MNTSESNLQILNQFEVYMSQKKSINTIRAYKSALNLISHLDWRVCTSTDLMSFRNSYVQSHAQSGSSLRIILIKNFFKFLCKPEVNIRQDNPASLLECPAKEKGKTNDCILISNEVYSEMYKDCGVPLLDKCSISLSSTCGLRISEICNLKVEDINFDNKTLLIKESKGFKTRLVPMSDISEQFIKQYMFTFNISNGYVIRNKFGNKMTESSLRKRYNNIRDRYGIDKSVNFHKGRHKYISTLCNSANVSLNIVSITVGHESTNTTRKYYHVDTKAQQEQVLSVINNMF